MKIDISPIHFYLCIDLKVTNKPKQVIDMKKIAFLLVMTMVVTMAFGQKNVRQTASNHLRSGKLDQALDAINQCIEDPSTSQDPKTWMLRGNIYLEIANTDDGNYQGLDPDPVAKALESYANAVEYDDKKRYFEDIFRRIREMKTSDVANNRLAVRLLSAWYR